VSPSTPKVSSSKKITQKNASSASVYSDLQKSTPKPPRLPCSVESFDLVEEAYQQKHAIAAVLKRTHSNLHPQLSSLMHGSQNKERRRQRFFFFTFVFQVRLHCVRQQ